MTVSDDKARRYALKLLSYRGRSVAEMEDRLHRKGFTPAVVSSTIRYLKAAGFLDDRALAEALKRDAVTRRMLSQAGVRNFLVQRKIPKDVIAFLVANDETTDIENARKLVSKRLRLLERYPPLTVKRRLYHFLLRRGYSSGTITHVLQTIHTKEEGDA